tara:strand:+ start:2240 stop:2887 length:648 start_codon:yes stop_codon:yes gene_type:complete
MEEKQQQSFLVIIITILLYAYIYGSHIDIIKLALASCIVYALFTLYSLSSHMDLPKDLLGTNQFENNFKTIITIEDIKNTLLINEDTKYLENDKKLVKIIISLYSVIEFDKEILKNTIINMNDFLRVYVISIVNDDPLLYMNLKDNQFRIQKLQDIKGEIKKDFKNFIYILKNNEYYEKFNIPMYIGIIDEYMFEKICILAHKFKIKSSPLNASL